MAGAKQALPQRSLTPNFLKISSIRHQRVKTDWIKFAPTKAVNHSQWMLTQTASARLVSMKLPAIKRIHRSKSIGLSCLIVACMVEAWRDKPVIKEVWVIVRPVVFWTIIALVAVIVSWLVFK